MFSLMGDFSGYKQIQVSPQDQHKTVFIMTWGTNCYKVIPFGIKNFRVTYQCAMTYVLHDMMNDIVEDYVDDVLVNSRTRDQYQEVLEKVFERLLKHNVR